MQSMHSPPQFNIPSFLPSFACRVQKCKKKTNCTHKKGDRPGGRGRGGGGGGGQRPEDHEILQGTGVIIGQMLCETGSTAFGTSNQGQVTIIQAVLQTSSAWRKSYAYYNLPLIQNSRSLTVIISLEMAASKHSDCGGGDGNMISLLRPFSSR